MSLKNMWIGKTKSQLHYIKVNKASLACARGIKYSLAPQGRSQIIFNRCHLSIRGPKATMQCFYCTLLLQVTSQGKDLCPVYCYSSEIGKNFPLAINLQFLTNFLAH